MTDHRLEIILAAKDISQQGFDAFKGRIQAITGNIFSMHGAVATLAGTGGFGLLVKSSLDAAGTIADTADRLGISTKVLQEYRYAAGQSGVETQKLDANLEKFTKNLGEARLGTGSLTTFLKKYDEQLLNNVVRARDTDAALDLVFSAMGKTADAADRAALSTAAFGKSGIDMTVMVKNGTAELEALRKEAEDLGLVLDEDLIRNAEAAGDSLDRIGQIIKMNVTGAVLELAPTITDVATQMTDWVKANKGLIDQKVEDTIGKIGTTADKLWKITSYDPAIIEYGLVGLVIGGKKGAVLIGGMAHMVEWGTDLARALELASRGLISFSDIASANFKELEELIKPFEGATLGGETLRKKIVQPINEAKDATDKLNQATGNLKATYQSFESGSAFSAFLDELKYFNSVDLSPSLGAGGLMSDDDTFGLLAAIKESSGPGSEFGKYFRETYKEIFGTEYVESVTAGATDGAKAQIEIYDEMLAEQNERYEKFLDNIQDLTSSVFKDIAHGQIRTMEDAWDRIKDYALDVLSEIAAKAVVSMVFDASGNGSYSGSGGLLSTVGALGGGALSFNSMGSLFSSGYSSLTGLFTSGGGASLGNFAGSGAYSLGDGGLGFNGISVNTPYQSGGGSSMGALSTIGYIVAAIMAQHALSDATDTVFEGQRTGDVFSGNFMTEPWLAYTAQQWGWQPTAGQKFDAAVQNQDWGAAAYRSPSVAAYWGDPAGTGIYEGAKNWLGETAAAIINPIAGLSDLIGELFGGSKSYKLGPFSDQSFTYGASDEELPWGQLGEWHESKGGWAKEYGYPVEEVMDRAVQSVYDRVDAIIETMPEELAASVTSSLENLPVKIGLEGYKFNLDNADASAGAFAEKIQTDMWAVIEPALKTGITDYVGGILEEAIDKGFLSDSVMGKLDSSGLFADVTGGNFKMAEGVDIDQYLSGANEVVATIDAMSAMWDGFAAEVEGMISPMTSFETGIKRLEDYFDSAYATAEALGFSEGKLTEIRSKETDALESMTEQFAGDRLDIFGDLERYLSDINGTATELDKALWSVDDKFESVKETLLDLGMTEGSEEWIRFIDIWQAAIDTTKVSFQEVIPIIEDVTEVVAKFGDTLNDRLSVQSLQNKILGFSPDEIRMSEIATRYGWAENGYASINQDGSYNWDVIEQRLNEYAAMPADKAASYIRRISEMLGLEIDTVIDDFGYLSDSIKSFISDDNTNGYEIIADHNDDLQRALAEQIRIFESFNGMLQSQIDKLYGAAIPSMGASVGQDFIDRAIESAASGVLPDTEKLSSAIAALTASFTSGNFESAFDLDRARLVLAGQLSILQAFGYDQLSELGVPGFASGGYHSGGLRIVGESGPEIEATGPAMYYDAANTMDMLAGDDNGELVEQIVAMREESRAQARSIASLQSRMVRLLERWDGDGIPEERVVG